MHGYLNLLSCDLYSVDILPDLCILSAKSIVSLHAAFKYTLTSSFSLETEAKAFKHLLCMGAKSPYIRRHRVTLPPINGWSIGLDFGDVSTKLITILLLGKALAAGITIGISIRLLEVTSGLSSMLTSILALLPSGNMT